MSAGEKKAEVEDFGQVFRPQGLEKAKLPWEEDDRNIRKEAKPPTRPKHARHLNHSDGHVVKAPGLMKSILKRA